MWCKSDKHNSRLLMKNKLLFFISVTTAYFFKERKKMICIKLFPSMSSYLLQVPWLACIVSIWYNCICVMVTLKVSLLCVLSSVHYNWPKGQAMCTVISFYTVNCLLNDYWRRVLYLYLYDKILINYLEHLKSIF
jgi:hypothetical protein